LNGPDWENIWSSLQFSEHGTQAVRRLMDKPNFFLKLVAWILMFLILIALLTCMPKIMVAAERMRMLRQCSTRHMHTTGMFVCLFVCLFETG
jgi:hypothetical protein